MDPLKKAIKFHFDNSLWPASFRKKCFQMAAKSRLNPDAVMLALVTGTAIFCGKSRIRVDGTDREEYGSLWVMNVQVLYSVSSGIRLCIYSISSSDVLLPPNVQHQKAE